MTSQGEGRAVAAPYPPVVQLLDVVQAAAQLERPRHRAAFFQSRSFDEYQQWQQLANSLILASPPGEPVGPGHLAGHLAFNQMNYQFTGPEGSLDRQVLYNSVRPNDQYRLARSAFSAARGLEDADTALLLLGMVDTAIHRRRQGHTRINVLNRQLFSPDGRGYAGTDADRAYYAELTTNPDVYLAQSPHPLWKGWVATYAEIATNHILGDMDYTGPPLTGIGEHPIRAVHDLLPEAWGFRVRESIAGYLTERDFATVAIAEFLRSRDVDVEELLEPTETGRPRFSLPRVAAFLIDQVAQGEEPDYIHDVIHDASGVQKAVFISRIIECVGHGENSFFDRDEIIAAYRLPQA